MLYLLGKLGEVLYASLFNKTKKPFNFRHQLPIGKSGWTEFVAFVPAIWFSPLLSIVLQVTGQ